jgi:hypothetical protein
MPYGESLWTKKICKQMEACGAMIFPIVASKMQQPGWPDRLVVCVGWCGLIEFKGVHTAIREVQRVRMRDIRKRGRYVFLAREPGELYDGDQLVGEFENGAELLQLIRHLVDPSVTKEVQVPER